MFKRLLASLLLVVLLFPSASTHTQTRRPNFLIIMSDDQRYDTMDYMPRTVSRIFQQGITFERAYSTSPTCTPSRSSVLTGMYAYNHEAVNNSRMLRMPTFVHDLHANGYHTGLIGKFLNAWDGSPHNEYDFMAAFSNISDPYPYADPTMIVNNEQIETTGYSTTIVRDYALDFLRDAAQQPEPFALLWTPYAPHTPASPARADRDLYPDLPPHRPPSFNEADFSDKPNWMQSTPLLNAADIDSIDQFRRRQLQSLNALDQSVEDILDLLQEQGRLDDTVVIYLSDNGLFWGEHRSNRKQWVYEEASHIPFAIRYPPLIAQPRTDDRLVANVDIAPTLYELAGLPIPHQIDGRSLVPLLKGTSDWRDSLLIETQIYQGHYYALHTDQYVYCELLGDRAELYNLETDPYQIDNVIDQPAYTAIATDLKRRLHQAVPGLTVDLPAVAR